MNSVNERNCTSYSSLDSEAYLEENVFKDGELLIKVLQLTLKENLNKKSNYSQKVVEFLHPHELQKEIPLEVGPDGCQTVDEIENLIETVVKYSVRTSHPYFFNQLYGGVDEVGLMSAWLLEALNTNQHTFEVAPVFIVLELHMLQEIRQLLEWEDGDGIFTPGGSIANMYGILLARHKKYPHIKESGLFGQKELVILTSDVSHYSMLKAANLMGFGTNHVIKVATDSQGRMRRSALQEAIRKARSEGKEPFLVNATAGTTVFGTFDPFEEIADICQEENIWLHVDGILGECNRSGASYIFQQDKFYDVKFDLGDKSLQCGRKPDALKLWLMLKVHGIRKLGARIDAAFEAARYLKEAVEIREGFRMVLKERECTNVCFWYIPPQLRNLPNTDEWWQKLHKVAPMIKAKIVEAGTLLVGYQPMESKNLVNFFRMVTTAYPISTQNDMDFVLNEIELRGKDIAIDL